MKRKAFTLIELMIVVAIIGILAAIAVPKFAELIDKSKEGYTKGALSTVRSAISVYYADNDGWYPADDLSSLLAGHKYMNDLPVTKTPKTGHGETRAVATGNSTFTFITDAGGWAYENAPSTPGWGSTAVNCSHLTLHGAGWSTF